MYFKISRSGARSRCPMLTRSSNDMLSFGEAISFVAIPHKWVTISLHEKFRGELEYISQGSSVGSSNESLVPDSCA